MSNNVSASPPIESQAAAHPAYYANLAVHLDGSAEDEVRVAHAEILAAAFEGRVTGLFTSCLPDISLYKGEMGMVVSMDVVETVQKRADMSIERLEQRFQRLSVPGEIRRIEDVAGGLSSFLATETRYADLFVCTCPRKYGEHVNWRWLIEAVMFESGRGLFLVPPGHAPRQPIRTVLVGWTDTKEAARSVAEALPLLRLASRVKVVTARKVEEGKELAGNVVLADIATYLARHGVQASVEILPSDSGAAAALLEEARRISADLIVVGSFGHSRLREWVLGGTTLELLEKSEIPLLMAH